MKTNRLARFAACALTGEEILRTLPESILLIRYGINAYTKNNENGEFEFTQEDADCVIADFEAKGHDLVIDYEHQSLSGEKAPAAGWIHKLERCAEGIKAHIRYWTDEAKEYLLAGQYRYFSPTLYFSRSGKHVTAIHSAALTNHPALHGIPALVADDLTGQDTGEAGNVLPPVTTQEITPLKKEEHMNELLLKLGLESFSSAEETLQKKALDERIDALLQTEEKLYSFLEKKNFSDLSEAEEALCRAETKSDPAAADAATGEDHAFQNRIRKAFHEGKLAESMRSWAERFASEDPEGFDLWALEAPRIIPDNADTECQALDSGTGSNMSFDPEQTRILHLLGLSTRDVKKTDETNNMKGNY